MSKCELSRMIWWSAAEQSLRMVTLSSGDAWRPTAAIFDGGVTIESPELSSAFSLLSQAPLPQVLFEFLGDEY